MWSGSSSAEPTARSLLAGPAEDLTPWWELDSRLAEYARARPRRATSAVASRCVDGRWVLEGPAPAWFRGAQDLLQGTPLALSDAFRVTQLLSAGDADDLEALLRVQVHRDPAAQKSAPAFAVESDPAAFRQEVPDDIYWGPDGLLGVACEPVGGRTRWYRLVERPSPAHGPRFVANALSLCQRQASRPKRAAPAPLLPLSPQLKRARPAPLLPLSPQLKRARSLASVDNFHDIDAAHALAELVSA